MTDTGFVVSGMGIPLYRWLTIRSGIKLESKGLKLSRGLSCTAIAKRELAVRGNRDKVLTAVNVHIATLEAQITPGVDVQAIR